jgi:hypothetical protein
MKEHHKRIIQFLSGPEKEYPLYFLAAVATDLMLMPLVSSFAMAPSQMKEHLCLLREINKYNLSSTRPILLDALYMIIKSAGIEGSIINFTCNGCYGKGPKVLCVFYSNQLTCLHYP